MTVISKPLVYDTIKDVLNSKGASVTFDYKTMFGPLAKIKYTARNKPVPFPKDFPTESDQHWRGKIEGDDYNTGRCGIDFPTYTSTSQLLGVTDPRTLWAHKYPTGGAAQPYRMDDFMGYDTDAKDLISNASRNPASGGLVLIGQANIGSVSVSFNNNKGTTALDYTEIGYRSSHAQWLYKFYFGLVLISEDRSWHGVMSQQYSMEELNNLSSGDYAATTDHYVFLMLDNGLFENNGTQKSGKFTIYPVLFLAKQNVKASSSAISVSTGFIPLPCKTLSLQTATVASMFNLSNLSGGITSSYGGYLIVNFKFTNKWENNLTINPNMPGKFKIRAFPYTGQPSDYPDKTYQEEMIQDTFECPGNSSINVSYQTNIYVEKGELVDLQVIFSFGTSTNVAQVSDAFIDPF